MRENPAALSPGSRLAAVAMPCARMILRHTPYIYPWSSDDCRRQYERCRKPASRANYIFKVAKPDGLTFGHFSAAVHRSDAKIARWKGAEIPGGAPQSSGWQKIAISVQDGKAEIYWNETKLPGGPFPIDRVQSGYIGVYANFVGGLGHAETKVDGLRVWPRK